MDNKKILNQIVISEKFGNGIVKSVDDKYIEVEFENGVGMKKLVIDSIYKKQIKFVDENLQSEIDSNAAGYLEKKQKEEDDYAQLINKLNTNKKLINHDCLKYRRKEGKPGIFLVCQSNYFDNEIEHGYIYAPKHLKDSEVASHVELELVKKGDIIIHHYNNTVYAISTATSDCVNEERPDIKSEKGRLVWVDCHLLEKQASTYDLKDKKILYGSYKFGPFDVNGKNKEGFYLSELSENLAKIFLEEAISVNGSDDILKEYYNKI